ncbi:MAG: hypothetical protein BMS9Abin36_1927 [Gammaproteobacteria bacterium]|nr:MAG: hypothetical protein BMS9Abin36_1927 [Gammaproteobacteria bacterium]
MRFLLNQRYGLFVMLSLMTVCSPAQAAHDAPAFSDPKVISPMSSTWKLQAVTPEAKNRDADLIISLGQQTYPALRATVERYAVEHKLNIVIRKGTCGISAGRLLRKTIDIGGFCCPPGATDRLPGLIFHTLAIAPIALITHPDNPISSVTQAEAKQIFSGKLSRWSALSSPVDRNSLIQPVGRLHCKVRPGHWRGPLAVEENFTPRLYEVGVIPDMIAQVSKSPDTIGYETLYMVRHHQSMGKVKVLQIDNHHPSDEEYMLKGHYPLYRTYNLTTWKGSSKRHQRAQALVEYLRSYIEKHHKAFDFIPYTALRKSGWKFRKDELIGEPVMTTPR